MPSSPVKSTAAAKSPRGWPRRDEASFGLTISTSWGNGHARIWCGLCRALSRGGTSYFLSATSPYYSAHRDLYELPRWAARVLSSWDTVLSRAERQLADADVALVGRALV